MSASLKTRMTIVVSLLVTLLLSAMAMISLSYFERQYKETISSYQYSVTKEMADAIDNKLAENSHALNLLASYITPELISRPEKFSEFFSEHLNTERMFDNGLFVISSRGEMLGGPLMEPQMKGIDYSSRDYFKKTVETGKSFISEPFISTQSNGHPIIVFTAPVFGRDGKLQAILCGSLDLLKDNILGRLANVRLGEKGYLYLFNESRTFIVHHDRTRIMKNDVPHGKNRLFDLAIKGFEGTGETVTSKGLTTLSSFRRLKTNNWIIAANLPRSEAYAPVYRAKSYLLAALIVVLLLSIFVVRFAMDRLTAPLISLTARVREIAVNKGAPEPIEIDKTVSREIATLGSAFNSMLTEMEERKRAEQGQLEFLRILLDTIPNPVFFKDKEGKYLGCNKALEELLGITREYLVGKTVYEILPREQADKHALMDEKILHLQLSQVYESQLKTANGTIRDLLFYKAAFHDPDGAPGGIIGTVVDISERRKAEFELAEHAEFAVNLVQNSTVPTFVLDKNHHVIIWNRACEELTGAKAYDVVGTNDIGKIFYGYKRPVLADFIVDGNLDELHGNYSNYTRSILIPKGIHAEKWFPELNGKERYISFTAAPIENSNGELIAVIQTIEDITGHKLAMEQLSESETRMRAILDTAADGIITVDRSGAINSVNRATELMFGYEAGALKGRNISFLLPALGGKRAGESDSGWYPQGIEGLAGRIETSAAKADGTEFPVEIALSEVQLGSRMLLTGIVTDITERKRADSEIQSTLSLLAATLESTADGILVVDNSKKIVKFNRKFAEMWNIPDEVLECRDALEIVSFVKTQLADPAGFYSRIRELYDNLAAESFDILEFRDGRIFERYSKPQRIGESIVGRVWNFRDVTEQQKLEMQLRHSQKMEAIGTLAGGVAHDFNNMLTAIIGFSSLVKQNLENNDPRILYLDQVLAAAERATGLTQSLLAYSRKEPLNPGRYDLNAIIRKVVKLLSRLIGEDIELTVSLHEGELPIMADGGQIEQVLMNLATNARDAIPGKGKLTISTDMAMLGEEFIKRHGYGKTGNHVHISVEDNGAGMDKGTVERIFEPFFTTKQIGRGTGLGLSIVYGIVKQHGGFITVNSEKGRGTRFDIYFPLAAGTEEEKEKPEELQIAGGTETLLVVEDSPEIRLMLRQVLEGAGYSVIEAVDGEDGVDKFIVNRDDVQLVIMDVIMPKKNGREAYEEIRSINGEVKAIFTSGYTGDVIDRVGMGGEFNFLSKPLFPNMILAKVREVLDAR